MRKRGRQPSRVPAGTIGSSCQSGEKSEIAQTDENTSKAVTSLSAIEARHRWLTRLALNLASSLYSAFNHAFHFSAAVVALLGGKAFAGAILIYDGGDGDLAARDRCAILEWSPAKVLFHIGFPQGFARVSSG